MVINTLNSNLEFEFSSHCFIKVDTKVECGFTDYLTPNEGHPENIKPHLDLAEKGILVSAGTERSFFNILFSNEVCEGLVIRDINTRVKAYADFNIMLLKICSNVEEFRDLSTIEGEFITKKAIFNKIHLIAKKILMADFQEHIKRYYLKNLKKFSKVYYKNRDWLDATYKEKDVFSECKYHRMTDQFSKLQRYAREGNIISTIGDISDLKFLENRRIAVVDTSNIGDYTFLKFITNSNPRIIWTNQNIFLTGYYSYIHESLSNEETEQFNQILKDNQIEATHIKNLSLNINECNFDASIGPFYTRKTLRLLIKNDF